MTDEEIAKLMIAPDGKTYGTSYIANNLAAHGCNETIVNYLHEMAARQNLTSFDRHMILEALKKSDPEAYNRELEASFKRLNSKPQPAVQQISTYGAIDQGYEPTGEAQ